MCFVYMMLCLVSCDVYDVNFIVLQIRHLDPKSHDASQLSNQREVDFPNNTNFVM